MVNISKFSGIAELSFRHQNDAYGWNDDAHGWNARGWGDAHGWHDDAHGWGGIWDLIVEGQPTQYYGDFMEVLS